MVNKIKRSIRVCLLGLLCAMCVGPITSSMAQQDSRRPSSAEAAALADQRKTAAAQFNKDDVLLRQAIQAKEAGSAALAGDDITKGQSAAELHKSDAESVVAGSLRRGNESLQDLLRSSPEIQKQLKAAERADPSRDEPEVRYRLFVSQSMGKGGIKAALEQAEANQDMVLVFRGLKRGQKFSDIMKLVTDQHVMKAGDSIPRIIIDPTLFTASGISVVPTLERFDGNGKTVASVRGVSNPKWLEEQVNAGRKGDLGALGTTAPIAEIDMIVLLKEQAAKIDMKAYGKKQVENFWKSRPVTRLPIATKSRIRKVDPTVVMTETIATPDGTVLAYPGQRLNPFDVAPFTMKLVVIDARDDAQVTWARRQVIAAEGKQIRIIATDFASEGGWKEYDRLVGDMGRMVYLLEPTLAQRFQLEKVPATVEGGDRVLIVREYAREELMKGVPNAGPRAQR